ncbi:MAG: FtsK/SpoIIIE domain-containing protein [Chloroflexota bacterium]|nr:FtsK/SpoIIIE domain-containing protein [Dehalococcoidia bacterium]MDW8255117.1 FtsK/SpoIIIE domain-containing protein [Chloroflexota bacterium]
MVQALDNPPARADDELRALLHLFRDASANVRQEIAFARERRKQAIQQAEAARRASRASADRAFSRVEGIYERARALLTETSRLSRADRATRLELLLGGFSGVGDPGAPPSDSDPAKQIASYADGAERALRYIQRALGVGESAGPSAVLRLVGAVVAVLGLSLAATSLLLGGSTAAMLVGLLLSLLGGAGVFALPLLVEPGGPAIASPAGAFEQLSRSLAGARRAYRRWLEEIDAAYGRAVREADAAYQQAIEILKPVFDQARAQVEPGLAALRRQLQPWLLDWEADEWTGWTPPDELAPVLRLGLLRAGVAMYRLETPAFVSLPLARPLLIKASPAQHNEALGLVVSLLFRLLCGVPPGRLHFSFFDPLGRGAAVAPFLQLADYDERFVRGRVRVTPVEIEDELAALLDDVVAPRRGGDGGNHVHVAVVLDFPEGFSETAAVRLWRLMQEGPAAGVWPIVLVDLARPGPIGVRLTDLDACATVVSSGKQGFALEEEGIAECELRPDAPPAPALATRLVQRVGRAVSRYTLLFDQIAPSDDQWWTGDAGGPIAAPIGARQNGEVVHASFGGEAAQHLAVIGGPDSGKTSLLRTLALSLALRYSPRELEILLFDADNGELAALGGASSHLRAERLTAAQELPLKLFQPVRAALDRRAALRRSSDLGSLAAFRRRSGTPLPRLVVVFDGLDDLFARGGASANDELTKLLSALLSVSGDGGVQVVMAFRSLARIPQPIRGVIPRVAGAVVLPLPAADAGPILGAGISPPEAPGHAVAVPQFLRPDREPFFVAHLGAARLEYYRDVLATLAGKR